MGQCSLRPMTALKCFEYLNEMFIAIGSGIWGLGILVHHGLRRQNYWKTMCIAAMTGGSLLYLFQSDSYWKPSPNKLVVISGCDSGLGYSLAIQLQQIGMQVIAGCLNPQCEGARHLESLGVYVMELNVTNAGSIKRALSHVIKLIETHADNVLWAVVNNAGMMVFAEFEWQTEKLMFDQINVNLLGCMRMTKAFLPLMREHKSRLINISSHCALESLPGLGVYGASKAAINGFNDALRVEMRKFGVRVISFIPGSFPTQSNILGKQMQYATEMRAAFTQEQRDFYDDYFQRYNSYLNIIARPGRTRKINSPILYEQFQHALLARKPRSAYRIEPWRYRIYHFLFKYTPTSLRDRFAEMFVKMPKYEQPATPCSSVHQMEVPDKCTEFQHAEESSTRRPYVYRLSSGNTMQSLSLSMHCEDSTTTNRVKDVDVAGFRYDGKLYYGIENIRFRSYDPAFYQLIPNQREFREERAAENETRGYEPFTAHASHEVETIYKGGCGDDESIGSNQGFYRNY